MGAIQKMAQMLELAGMAFCNRQYNYAEECKENMHEVNENRGDVKWKL